MATQCCRVVTERCLLRAAERRLSYARHRGCGILRKPAGRHNLQPMRILQIIPTYYPAVRYGGPIRSVHALSRSLVELGHEVHVFTSSMDGPTDLDVPLNRPVNLDGVAVHYFPAPWIRRLAWCPAMQAALKTQIADFDVLHLHAIFVWPTSMAARVAKSTGVPFVLSPRGMLGAEVIRRKSRLVKSAWIRLIETRTLRDAAAIHVTSELEAEEIRTLRLGFEKLRCIPNGLSCPTTYAPIEAGPFAALPRPYALFLSRISWKKGLDRLIKSWKEVPELSLVIAGNDEEDYLPRLRALAAAEGVSARLHFIGEISDQHKWALYENAALFVLPSYSENFGNVVAEAMAVGCPVIVTPEVGLASFVRESGAGLVANGEPALLAKAINELRCDEEKRKKFGAAGRHAVRMRLSWSAVATQLVELYQSYLAA